MTDVEKARAIFVWIAHNITYDVDAYLSGAYIRNDYSASSVLRQRKAVCEGYANLFQSLADKAGLQSAKISGCAKGFGYKGVSIFSEPDHAWNAVRLDGDWYLLDCTWASGGVDANKQFIADFDGFFFLTPPEQFIHTHYPQERSWQLLKESISIKKFASLTPNHKGFFKANQQMQALLENRDKPTPESLNEATADLNHASVPDHSASGPSVIPHPEPVAPPQVPMKPTPPPPPAPKPPPRPIPNDATAMAAQQRAMGKFPQLAVKDSPLNRAFVELMRRYQTERPEIFDDPDWPAAIAAIAALTLEHPP